MVAVSDFSGLESSAYALASAAAIVPTDLLDWCMGCLPAQDIEAHSPGFRPFGPDAVPGILSAWDPKPASGAHAYQAVAGIGGPPWAATWWWCNLSLDIRIAVRIRQGGDGSNPEKGGLARREAAEPATNQIYRTGYIAGKTWPSNIFEPNEPVNDTNPDARTAGPQSVKIFLTPISKSVYSRNWNSEIVPGRETTPGFFVRGSAFRRVGQRHPRRFTKSTALSGA
jgi:hypothetical protein